MVNLFWHVFLATAGMGAGDFHLLMVSGMDIEGTAK
jgi:hypothetical protein